MKSAYEEHSDDEAKKADGRSENFDDQNSNKESRISSIRQGGARSNLIGVLSSVFPANKMSHSRLLSPSSFCSFQT